MFPKFNLHYKLKIWLLGQNNQMYRSPLLWVRQNCKLTHLMKYKMKLWRIIEV